MTYYSDLMKDTLIYLKIRMIRHALTALLKFLEG